MTVLGLLKVMQMKFDFQKKAIPVQAYYYTTREVFEKGAPDWAKKLAKWRGPVLVVDTEHRTVVVARGTWLVSSTSGDFCTPVSAITFEKLYERVNNE